MNEDWDLLLSFLPRKWAELAGETGALKGLRKDKSVDGPLRALLVHLGCGYPLRKTVVRPGERICPICPTWPSASG